MRTDVAEWFIRNFTNENDLVLDPFMGMGTTGLVCGKNKRNYIGFELIQEYRDRATERINDELAQTTIFDFIEEP